MMPGTLHLHPSGCCQLSQLGRSPSCNAPPGWLGDPWAAARATMTDYGEELCNELEALESIYPNSFTFLEDAGNNVEVDESLFQEMDDLDEEEDPDNNPADPESDLTDEWTIRICREVILGSSLLASARDSPRAPHLPEESPSRALPKDWQ
ncbi:hypothetical protein GH733_007883 [Mirounga leonina]|nr:hypothetical protein GH733_007883 [Mirounga leonina]